MDYSLKAETVGKGVCKPLFNVEYFKPGQVDLNGGVLNLFGQGGSKKAQHPFISWTQRASGMELTKLSTEQDKLCLGRSIRLI